MSRASISTGNILFDTNTKNRDEKKTKGQRDDSKPFHIAVIGDFSGRGSRGKIDAPFNNRAAIVIDRDNFDDVFAQLKVSLQLPFSEAPISFSEFDDLHPDYLYDQVSLFSQFRTLKRKLKKPELFEQAVSEIQQWSTQKAESKAQAQSEQEQDKSPEEGIPLPDNMLDAILSQSQSNTQSASPIGDIQQLIKDIVSPYVEAKADPRLAEMEQAVDEATADTLRKIMHNSAFQELEANWRSLYMLVRRLETNSRLKIFIIDISRDELLDDVINQNDFSTSALNSLLVEKYKVPGAIPFSLLQFNVQLEDDLDDLRLASAMANVAASNGAYAVAASSEKLACCSSLHQHEDIVDWQYEIDEEFSEGWNSLRQDPNSEHLSLIAPRFLLRLPYGQKTSPIESFRFEELSKNNAHEFYLWGNSATLITLLVAQSYLHFGGQLNIGQINEIKDLPLHVYQDEDGGSATKACAEIYMQDSAADKLAEAGIMSARSVKNSTSVLIPRFRSIAINGKDIYSD